MKKNIVKLLLSVIIPFALFGIFSFILGYTEWVRGIKDMHQLVRGWYCVLSFVLVLFVWGGEYLQ